VNDLQRDLEISDEVVAERFDFRRHAARPSLWARLKGMFGVRGPV